MGILFNKVAVITGGGQGIGVGIALQVASAGAEVIIAQRNVDNAEMVASEIKKLGGSAVVVPLDVTNSKSIKNCVQKSLCLFSQIDILINNAGVMQKKSGTDTSAEDFDICYEVNVKGLWGITSEFIPHFKGNGAGKIINISSVGGRRGWAETPAYGSSKAAVINLTQSLALALGPYNINANTICPGLVKTAMMTEVKNLFTKDDEYECKSEEVYLARAAERTPLKRLATPEDIGHAVVFLASDYAKSITGQSLNIDGGLFMS